MSLICRPRHVLKHTSGCFACGFAGGERESRIYNRGGKKREIAREEKSAEKKREKRERREKEGEHQELFTTGLALNTS